MLVDRLARPMLAAIFVVGGIDTLREPDAKVKTASPMVQAAVDRFGENGLPARVPTDPATLVKVDAGVKIVAGLALALNKFPRLAALVLALNLVPTTYAAHAYWEHEDPAERGKQRLQLLKNLGLFGGLLSTALRRSHRPE